MLVDRGFLVRENGSWRLAQPELPLPESVQGTIAARVDALPADEKAVLQHAAVVGKVFWLGAVTTLGGAERDSAERRYTRSSARSSSAASARSSVADDAVRLPPRARPRRRLRAASARTQGRVAPPHGGLARVGIGRRGARGAARPSLHVRRRAAARSRRGHDRHRAAGGRGFPPGGGARARRERLRGGASLLHRRARASTRMTQRPQALLGLGRARSHAEGGGIDERAGVSGVRGRRRPRDCGRGRIRARPVLWSAWRHRAGEPLAEPRRGAGLGPPPS